MLAPETTAIMDALNKTGLNARFVGGCIRNHFVKKDVYDIDIAINKSPKESVDLLQSAQIKTIPTGIKHGTITAVINQKTFEITSLRSDIETDGRHAKITFTDDWGKDASRRDFTINALYADRDGTIYDPLGNSIHDLQNGIVRFIGDADTRIREDYLRILRFFRFDAEYAKTTPNADAIQACINNRDGIEKLSNERIADEIYKTLSLSAAPRALQNMKECKILLPPESDSTAAMRALIPLQEQLNAVNVDSRYYISEINKKYIKNRNINIFFNKLDKFIKSWNGDVKLSLYRHGKDVTLQGLLILISRGHAISDIIISDAMSLPIPQFPLTAEDVMKHLKLPQGPKVGDTIRQGETLWIQSGFALKIDEILFTLQQGQSKN